MTTRLIKWLVPFALAVSGMTGCTQETDLDEDYATADSEDAMTESVSEGAAYCIGDRSTDCIGGDEGCIRRPGIRLILSPGPTYPEPRCILRDLLGDN